MFVKCKSCCGCADAEVGICPDCLAPLHQEAGGKYPQVVQSIDERAANGITPMVVWAEAVQAMVNIGK